MNKQKKILVVDDEDVFGGMVVDILENEGFSNVRRASSGQEGVEMIEEHKPDLVITDLTMLNTPVGGAEVAEFVKEKHPGIGVIVMSGNYGEGVQDRLRGAGVGQFLNKPFSREDLMAAVNAVLVAPPSPSAP